MGTLTAIDLNKGTFAWQKPFGEYPELAAKRDDEYWLGELRRRDCDCRRTILHCRDKFR